MSSIQICLNSFFKYCFAQVQYGGFLIHGDFPTTGSESVGPEISTTDGFVSAQDKSSSSAVSA